MPFGTVGRILVLALVLLVAGLALCQADGDHAGLIDPCTIFLATIALGAVALFSLGVLGYSLPALAHAYNLHSPELTAPPPEA